MADSDETACDRVKKAREAAGYKTAAAAIRRFGWYPESTYRSHENGQGGKGNVPPEEAEKYAKAYGVRKAWLLTGELPVRREEATLIDTAAIMERLVDLSKDVKRLEKMLKER